MPKRRRPQPTDWTTFSGAVNAFGWTGPAAWARFRRGGLLETDGTPHEQLLRHGVARKTGRRWEWNKPLLEALLEHIGAKRLSPIDHVAWRAVQEFQDNMARARRLAAKGAEQSDIQVMELAAAVGLMAGKPAQSDPQEAEKFQALSKAMYLAGYGETFQEQLLLTMQADAPRVMAAARQDLMDIGIDQAQGTTRRPRL